MRLGRSTDNDECGGAVVKTKGIWWRCCLLVAVSMSVCAQGTASAAPTVTLDLTYPASDDAGRYCGYEGDFAYTVTGLVSVTDGELKRVVVNGQEAQLLSPREIEMVTHAGGTLTRFAACVWVASDTRLSVVVKVSGERQQRFVFTPEADAATNRLRGMLALAEHAEGYPAVQLCRLHRTLGLALYARPDLTAAADHHRAAIAICNEDPIAHDLLGLALHDMELYDEAMAAYQRAIELEPEYFEAYNNIGMLLDDQGELEAGVEWYEKCLAINPDYEEAHFNFAWSLFDRGKIEDAAGEFLKCLAICPEDADAHYALALVYVELKQYTKAKEHALEAIRIKPDAQNAPLLVEKLEAMGY
jgi:tetratricopeptide (TPR) repeat protein